MEYIIHKNFIKSQILPKFNMALEFLGWRVQRKLQIKNSNSHLLIKFEYSGKKFIYKFAKFSKVQIEKQVLAFEILKDLTPKIFYSDDVGLIEEFIEGDEIRLDAKQSIWEKIGVLISEVHSFDIKIFDKTTSKNNSKKDDLCSFETKMKSIYAQKILNRTEINKLETYLLSPPSPADHSKKACHGDFWTRNILYNKNLAEAKLIDWEDITSNYREYDFVLFTCVNDEFSIDLMKQILNTYLYDLNVDLIDYFKVKRLIDNYKQYVSDEIAIKQLNQRLIQYKKHFI